MKPSIIFWSSLLFGSLSSAGNSYPGAHPPIDTRTLAQQYAAASAESGELVVRWGGDELSQGAPVIQAWQATFPKVKLNLIVDVSKYHDSHIDRAYEQSGSDGADIAVLQTLHDFDRWKRQGRLMDYKPSTWDTIYTDLKDQNGAFMGASMYGFGNMIYNPKLVTPSQVPNTWLDILNPIWKNKLVLTYPNDDDAICYLFSLIIDRYGWGWMDALAAQNVHWVRGTGAPATVLSSPNTSYALSFTTIGGPNVGFKPTSDTSMMWPQTAAIFATTQRPESAKLFVSWLMSDGYQQNLAAQGLFLTRKVANTTSGSGWWDQPIAATQFGKFMGNREQVEWWRLQFETALGTPQGPSPLLGIV